MKDYTDAQKMQMLSASKFCICLHSCTHGHARARLKEKEESWTFLNMVWNKTDGLYFAHIGFQWSRQEEEEDYLIDKSLMIK